MMEYVDKKKSHYLASCTGSTIDNVGIRMSLCTEAKTLFQRSSAWCPQVYTIELGGGENKDEEEGEDEKGVVALPVLSSFSKNPSNEPSNTPSEATFNDT